ncbi:MAG: hypothetical protein GXO89_02000 [Chlorobi bacterium]|nr:hypothetical protein [Chlorobiota bacterium]
MATVKLPETELTEMRQFYEEELSKTLKRLQHIKNVLDNIGSKGRSIQIQISETEGQKEDLGTSNPIPAPTKEKARKKKRGPKSIWEDLIIKRLRHINMPMTYDELTNEIMTFGKIPEEKRKNTKQSILNVVFRLRKRNTKIKTFSSGSREKYVGLKRWFDSNGEIKEEYRKVATPRTKTKEARKDASPPKGKTEKNTTRSRWSDYVLELLRAEDKPMPIKTLTERAMKEFNIEAKLFDKTKLAVTRSMSQLDKKSNKVGRYRIKGSRSGYFGLKEWFDTNGQLKQEYKEKIKS